MSLHGCTAHLEEVGRVTLGEPAPSALPLALSGLVEDLPGLSLSAGNPHVPSWPILRGQLVCSPSRFVGVGPMLGNPLSLLPREPRRVYKGRAPRPHFLTFSLFFFSKHSTTKLLLFFFTSFFSLSLSTELCSVNPKTNTKNQISCSSLLVLLLIV